MKDVWGSRWSGNSLLSLDKIENTRQYKAVTIGLSVLAGLTIAYYLPAASWGRWALLCCTSYLIGENTFLKYRKTPTATPLVETPLSERVIKKASANDTEKPSEIKPSKIAVASQTAAAFGIDSGKPEAESAGHNEGSDKKTVDLQLQKYPPGSFKAEPEAEVPLELTYEKTHDSEQGELIRKNNHLEQVLNRHVNELGEKQACLDKAQLQLAELARENSQYRNQVQVMAKQQDGLIDDRRQFQEERRQMQANIKKTRADLAVKERDIEGLLDKQGTLEYRLASQQREQEAQGARLALKTDEVEQLYSACEALQARIDRVLLDKKQQNSVIAQIKEEKNAIRNDVEYQLATIGFLNKKIHDLEQQLREKEKAISLGGDKVQELTDELEHIRLNMQGLFEFFKQQYDENPQASIHLHTLFQAMSDFYDPDRGSDKAG